MSVRVVTESGIRADVRTPDHFRFFSSAEQAMGPRKRTDPVPRVGVHSGGEEQRKPAVTIGHTDCGVSGSRQGTRTVQNAAQHLLAAPLSAELADHIEQPA